MATSVYFNGAVQSEQNLYEDLVLESIKMFGQDVVYVPREQIYEDEILNETLNQYRHAYPIECFIENSASHDSHTTNFIEFHNHQPHMLILVIQ